jgi:hypothetical protein
MMIKNGVNGPRLLSAHSKKARERERLRLGFDVDCIDI